MSYVMLEALLAGLFLELCALLLCLELVLS